MTFPALHVIARSPKATEAISKNRNAGYINPAIFIASFFLALFLLVISPTIISSPSLAQSPQPITPNSQPPTNYNTPNLNPEVPRNQHTFAQSAMIEAVSSVFCLVTGIDPINPAQGCLDIDPKTHKLGLRPPQDGKPQLGGLIGLVPGMFSQLYVPPASSRDYFHYLAGNFGITKPAYAQTGGGFGALRPLLPLWTAARNVAYLLFVLVFIIIGLAIMLRVKIDPRTVMTLQNQIPRIIVGILLVTFSYAIAGLMVDGMWLLTYAGINTITQANVTTDPATTTNPDATNCSPGNITLQQRATKNLLSTTFNYADMVLKRLCHVPLDYSDGIAQMTLDISWMIGGIVGDAIRNALIGDTQYAGSCDAPLSLNPLTWIKALLACGASVATLALDTVVSFIVGIVALLIIYITLIVAMFRVWFELLKAYVMVILYIIAAPLWIVVGLLPGKPLGFEKWLRRMFVHLAVFPAVACLLVVAAVIMNLFDHAGANSFVPPLVGQPNMSSFGSLLAFAVVLMTPSLLEVLKANLKATSEGGKIAGAGVIGSIASGAAGPKGLGRGVSGLVTRRGAMGESSEATKFAANLADKVLPERYRQTAKNIIYKVGGESTDQKTGKTPH